jgi:acyl carrier protein
MTDNDLLQILNAAVKLARPVGADDIKIESLDTPIKDTGLDSLDILMVSVYISDVYGVSEEDMKLMAFQVDSTIRDFMDFMIEHKTKDPQTLEEALKAIK